MIRRALGRDSVEGASIVRLDDAQDEATIACDTIVLATGAAPVIEHGADTVDHTFQYALGAVGGEAPPQLLDIAQLTARALPRVEPEA